jgi:hypothetical protein
MGAELIAIGNIKPNENNPRFIKDAKFEKLVRSVKEFSAMLKLRPIIVDEDMRILGGNMRYNAAKHLKMELVYIDIFTKQMAAEMNAENLKEGLPEKTYNQFCNEFLIKDNASFGEWDWDILANEWKEDDLEDWGLELLNNQDWTQLNYIEEAEKPNFRKDNIITIVVPDELVNEIKEIEKTIKSLLGDKYSGCEVK